MDNEKINNLPDSDPIPRKMKQWSRMKGENAWTMFKVMAEFVDGFEKLNHIGPCISIFGSARTKANHLYYKIAVDIAHRLTREGYGIITGGGPGIMEAGNKGASLYGGTSVGLNITLPHEQNNNQFIDLDKSINHRYFFVRKVMFVKYAQAFVVLPGGFGTMDELFEVLTLIQTRKINRVPVILVGSEYWSGMRNWLHDTLMEREGNIHAEDLELFNITDSPAEVVQIINDWYGTGPDSKGELSPNYEL